MKSGEITELPVKRVVLNMVIPTAFSMLMTFLFQLVDTYFIGQLGTKELAAVSFAFPVYFLIVGLFMGLSSGVSSAVGKALGEKNNLKAQQVTFSSILSFIPITILIGILGYFTIRPTFTILGASAETLNLTARYISIIYLGMFALVGTLIANAALMSKGAILSATIVMGIGGLVNLILDYLLIFGYGSIPALGLQGAALATVLSWMLTLMLMIVLLAQRELISFRGLKMISKSIGHLKEVLNVGFPAVMAQILNPLAIAVITKMIASYGDASVAAYGIATRIESLVLTGVFSLSVVLTPIAAQNYGAKAHKRLQEIILYAEKKVLYWCVFFYLLLFFFVEPLSRQFTDQEEIITDIRYYFIIVGISFSFFGLTLITNSIFNGVYQPKKSLKITLIKALLLTVPFVVIGSFISLEGIWVGIALANIIGFLYSNYYLNAWAKKINSSTIKNNRFFNYFKPLKLTISS